MAEWPQRQHVIAVPCAVVHVGNTHPGAESAGLPAARVAGTSDHSTSPTWTGKSSRVAAISLRAPRPVPHRLLEVLLRRLLHGCNGVPYTGCVPLGLEVLLRRLLHGCNGVPYTGCVPLGLEVLLTAFPTRVLRRSLHGLCAPRA